MHKGQRIVSKWAMIAFYCGCRFLNFSPFKPLDIFQIVHFVSRLFTWTELCIHNGSDTAGWYYYEICQKKSEGCDHRNHRLSMLWSLMWPQVCGLLTRHVHSGPSAISFLSSFKNKCLNGLYFLGIFVLFSIYLSIYPSIYLSIWNIYKCWVVFNQPLGKNNPIAGFVHILQCAGLFLTKHFLECRIYSLNIDKKCNILCMCVCIVCLIDL